MQLTVHNIHQHGSSERTQAGKKSVEDNFDEMLKVFEVDADLQGQICESSTSVSFFIYIYYGYYIYVL